MSRLVGSGAWDVEVRVTTGEGQGRSALRTAKGPWGTLPGMRAKAMLANARA